MLVEFKEKTYEKYFSQEMTKMTNYTFSPDQNDEYYLGFDEAIWLAGPDLAYLAPYIRLRKFRKRIGLEIEELDNIPDKIWKKLPSFKCNLFVQYKRPEYMFRTHASEWGDWRSPYYRYSISNDQHEKLESIRQKGNGRVSVVYASPAFWSAKTLYNLSTKREIVDFSNIVCSGYVNGHSKYTYQNPGTIGKAHSESTDIESEGLTQIFESHAENENATIDQEMLRLSKNIDECCGIDKKMQSQRDQILRANGYENLVEGRLSYAFANIKAISELLDSRIYLIS